MVPKLARKQYEENLVSSGPYTSQRQPRIVIREVLGGNPEDPNQTHLQEDWPHKMVAGLSGAWWSNLPARELKS